jgi:hypothetical protein
VIVVLRVLNNGLKYPGSRTRDPGKTSMTSGAPHLRLNFVSQNVKGCIIDILKKILKRAVPVDSMVLQGHLASNL